MKKIIITFSLILLSGLVFSQGKTINSFTSRSNPASTDALLMQTSGNVSYKILLDSIKVYSIDNTRDSLDLYADSVRYLYDSLDVLVKYRDSLTTYATPSQISDSLSQDYGCGYKTSARSITANSATEWYTLTVLTQGRRQGVTFDDSLATVVESGDYLILYNSSISANPAEDELNMRIVVNTTAKDEGKQTHYLGENENLYNISGQAVLALSDGDTVKIQVNIATSTTLSCTNYQLTLLKL